MTRSAIKKAREKYIQGNPKRIIYIEAMSSKKYGHNAILQNKTNQDVRVIVSE